MSSDYSSPFSYHHRAPKGGALALVAALALAGLPQAGNAQTPKKANVVTSLEGSWSGGGTVTFASGGRERASCRARYSRAGKEASDRRARTGCGGGSVPSRLVHRA
jgi:hypothetical protein